MTSRGTGYSSCREAASAFRSEALEADPEVGSEVSITPIDTGRANSSSGVLAYIDATRAGLLHHNDRVGDVLVHFPRFGYRVQTIL
jgi:hypothetical protein